MQAFICRLSLPLCSVFRVQKIVGVDDGEGPPVPIPNTVVKLAGAEDTCLATDRENREMPTQCGGSALAGQSLLYIPP